MVQGSQQAPPAGERHKAAATVTPADLRPAPPQPMNGAEAIVRSLEHAGVDTVFGIPGGAILPTYDPLMDSSKLRHILVRHEQGSGHAAEGYAYTSGKVGVCMATSGPGATNLVTALADANMDSVPVVAITGQVAAPLIGTDAFQEADIVGITLPVTKHNFLVTDADDIPRTIAQAFHIASTGRPGPGAGRRGQVGDAGADHVHLAHRPGPAGLPPGHQAARQAGPRGRAAAGDRRAGRCSTSAAARCARVPRRSCAGSSTSPAPPS